MESSLWLPGDRHDDAVQFHPFGRKVTKATHNEVFTTFIREASLAILRRVSLTLRVVDRRDEATSSWGVWHVRPEGLVQDKERRARFNAVFEEPGEARG